MLGNFRYDAVLICYIIRTAKYLQTILKKMWQKVVVRCISKQRADWVVRDLVTGKKSGRIGQRNARHVNGALGHPRYADTQTLHSSAHEYDQDVLIRRKAVVSPKPVTVHPNGH